MRAVFVSPFDPAPPRPGQAARAHVGGVERVLHRLAHEVAARGHDVTILCSSEGPGGADWEGDLRIVRVRRLATLLRAPVAALADHLPRDADLVHVPATYPFTTPAVLRGARRLGVPCVLDFHFEPDPGTRLGRAAARAYRALGPPSYRHAARVLVRSRAYARASPSLRGTRETAWRVVPNGVDTDHFRPEAGAPVGGYVLVVGRLVPYKGVEVLLHALAGLRDPPPLVVAGDGPLRTPLVALAERLQLTAAFLGRVPDPLLPRLYRSAHLTVLPSVNRQEAFGLALAESMACGTPVVASRLPGVEEVAREGGLLAEPGSAASLRDAIARAFEPGALPRGEALAARVRARYAWPVVAERLLDVYSEILDGEVGPPRPREVVHAHPRGRTVL